MAQTQYLDLVTGGSLLPYIYCKKITLENSQQEGHIKAILNLEIYRDSNDFTKSPIFNMFNNNLQNYLYMQIAPFTTVSNVSRLQPNYSTNLQNKAGNAYIAKSHPKYNVHYAPYIHLDQTKQRYTHLPIGLNNSTSRAATYGDFVFDNEGIDNLPPPVMIGDSLTSAPSRQEVVNGKPYDVLTYEYVYEYSVPQDSIAHLGFLFYCFLDVPEFIAQSENLPSTNIKILTGPVNTEIVLRNGTVSQNRYQFFTTDGQKWNSSVHLHTENNPDESDPDNPYFGDGSAGVNKGWMAGEKHISKTDQPRLNLALIPNYKIQDFRSKKITLQENVLGLAYVDGKRTLSNSKFTESQLLTSDVAKYFLMPFQKEARKYISKIDYIAGRASGDLVANNTYDNDSEYSKLYINKDAVGQAHGVFMIDFLKLLSNNSNIFSLLSPSTAVFENILAASELLEINIYRDRVEKKPLGNLYETYVNDTFYEEPSHLIAVFSKGDIERKNLMRPVESTTNNRLGCFSFSDNSLSEQQSGAYQYRVEIYYKDGTYTYLQDRLNALKSGYSDLQQYHELSQGSFTEDTFAGKGLLNYVNSYAGSSKTVVDEIFNSAGGKLYTPYYKDGAFHERFNIDAASHFIRKPWSTQDNSSSALVVVAELAGVFAIDKMWSDKVAAATSFINMVKGLDPIQGSPYGIELALKTTQTLINRIEKILGINKKRGSSLTAVETLTSIENNNFSTPSAALIKEYHTFDHPSEIIRATPNKDVYVDYISTGDSKQSNNIGLLDIQVSEFKNRCLLDLVELSPAFQGKGNPEETINLLGPSPIGAVDIATNSAYSYLSPSILSLTGDNYISKFKLDADYTTIAALEDTSADNYTQFLNALISYNLSKNHSDDYDNFTVHNIVTEINNEPVSGMPTKLDETYKDIFDTIGITVHNSDKYNEIFNKDAGAVSKKIEPGNGALLPKSEDDYGDSKLGDSIKIHLDGLLYDDTDFFNSPIKNHPVDGLNYNVALPNIHKIAMMIREHNEADVGLEYTPRSLFAESIDSEEMTSYSFINYNFISQIEVYDAMGIDPTRPLKDDSYIWRLLNQNDINDLENGVSLLCRLRFFNQELTQGINMPLVNNIFFLKSGGIYVPVTYGSAVVMPYVLSDNKQLQLIVQDLRNESVAAVKKASNKKGKNLLAGKAANQSGVSQAGVQQSSPVEGSQQVNKGPVAGQKTFGSDSGTGFESSPGGSYS